MKTSWDVYGTQMQLECPVGAIRVLSSLYGSESKPECGSIVTSYVREKCDGERTCNLAINNQLFGYDSCTNVHRQVVTAYRCDYSESFTYKYFWP